MVAKVSPLAVPKFLTALDRSPDAVRLLVIEHRAEFAHVEPATARFTLKKCSRTQHWQRNATTAESGFKRGDS
jgi:hypothetical protein